MATASPNNQPPADSGHWLYGRWIDLLVGCCGIYVLSIPLLLGITMSSGTRHWPAALTILLGISINAPHYGATLVRLYERAEDRRKYLFFTLHVTVAIAALFVIATRNLWLASVLITAYVTWSPWHFSAQNYGLLLMFLRRKGVEFDTTTKRLFYASFIFSTAMAIEGVQATSSDLVLAPATVDAPNIPDIIQWPPLQEFAVPLLFGTGFLYFGCLAAALIRLRGTSIRNLGPAAALIATQALFTAVPVVAARVYTSGEINLAFAPFWLSMAHSAQYLWVSAYFAKRSGAQSHSARFLGKSFLAGSGITILPALLFAPAVLGSRPWDAGLASLVFAMVNLHHFIMDGAIWKLRDGRISNILLRGNSTKVHLDPRSVVADGTEPPAGATTNKLKWLPALVWTSCTLTVFVPLIALYETQIGIPTATRAERIDLAMDRLRFIGRDSLNLHSYVGREYSKLNQPAFAIAHFEHSLELFPTPKVWTELGNEHRGTGEIAKARAAFDAALAIDSDYLGALMGGANSRILDVVEATPDEKAEARSMLDRVIKLYPDHPEAKRLRSHLETSDT